MATKGKNPFAEMAKAKQDKGAKGKKPMPPMPPGMMGKKSMPFKHGGKTSKGC